MKINQILKKYKQLHKKHLDSWEDAQKRIHKSAEDIYQFESYNYMRDGNNLLDAMMKELEGKEIFTKHKQSDNGNK